MRTTQRTTVVIPTAALEQARETWPEISGMSSGRVLRFTLAYALTGDANKAIAATQDTRIGTKRTPKTE
jgi:hypothetical protein